MHGGGSQQHQPDWNHARDQPDQSGIGLGGEHAPQRRPVYTAGRHHSRGAECHLERTGKVVFYTGYAPVAGEQIAVNYRTVGRAVGRAVNTASQQALTQAGTPAVAAWIGSVTNPPARSSTDCLNAALAIEQAAAGVSALWSGAYSGTGQALPPTSGRAMHCF